MSEETRRLGLGAVLSVTSGVLVAPIGDLYEILNWMTGESLMTHQLPRASRDCAPVLLAAHPMLRSVDASGVTPETWEAWLAEQVSAFGERLDVPKLAVWEHRDAMEELREMAPHMKIITVRAPGGDS